MILPAKTIGEGQMRADLEGVLAEKVEVMGLTVIVLLDHVDLGVTGQTQEEVSEVVVCKLTVETEGAVVVRTIEAEGGNGLNTADVEAVFHRMTTLGPTEIVVELKGA